MEWILDRNYKEHSRPHVRLSNGTDYYLLDYLFKVNPVFFLPYWPWKLICHTKGLHKRCFGYCRFSRIFSGAIHGDEPTPCHCSHIQCGRLAAAHPLNPSAEAFVFRSHIILSVGMNVNISFVGRSTRLSLRLAFLTPSSMMPVSSWAWRNGIRRLAFLTVVVFFFTVLLGLGKVSVFSKTARKT